MRPDVGFGAEELCRTTSFLSAMKEDRETRSG